MNPIRVFGKDYESFAAAWREHGTVPYDTALYRFTCGKYTIEECLTMPAKSRAERNGCHVVIDGTPYSSLREACQEQGVRYNSFCVWRKVQRKLRRPHTLEDFVKCHTS